MSKIKTAGLRPSPMSAEAQESGPAANAGLDVVGGARTKKAFVQQMEFYLSKMKSAEREALLTELWIKANAKRILEWYTSPKTKRAKALRLRKYRQWLADVDAQLGKALEVMVEAAEIANQYPGHGDQVESEKESLRFERSPAARKQPGTMEKMTSAIRSSTSKKETTRPARFTQFDF